MTEAEVDPPASSAPEACAAERPEATAGQDAEAAGAAAGTAGTAAAAAGTAGWYYVLPDGTPLGPYDAAGMQALVVGGYVQPSTCVWREGCASWAPISTVEELRHLLAFAPAPGSGEAQAAAAAAAKAAGHAPTKLSQPAKRSQAAPVDPDLAAFEAEISALEGEEDPPADADASAAAGPGTPEELEFEDDDGTTYTWDARVRKYVAKELHEAGAVEPDYADMVYAGDEEVLPSLQAARAAAAAQAMQEAADDANKGKGKRPAGGGGGVGAGAEGGGLGDGADAEADEAAAALAEAAGAPRKGKKARKVPADPKADDKPQGWFDLKVNTSVYVTGLPDDVTVKEIVEVFSKFGLIKEDEKGQHRVKLYQDKATGMPKGDALVTYLREPSVNLAVQMLDGTPFRFNMGTNMTVGLAKFEMKGDTFQAKQAQGKGQRKKQLQKLEKRLQWGGVDDKLPAEKVTVIIKHMFVPQDFLDNMMLAEELETDVKAECSKLGALEKVRVFKTNPEGVVSVRFKEAEPAQKCIQLMHGRWFGGRQLVAHMYDGLTNYVVKVRESWEEQEARLEAFAKELEEKEAMEEAEAKAAK